MQNIIRKETVSIHCKELFAGVNKFMFPDNENLRNIKLLAIQSYYDTILTNGIPSNEFTLISKEQLQNSFLTCYDCDGVQFLNKAPLIIFQTIQINADITKLEKNGIVERDAKILNCQKLDLQNSYVEIFSAAPARDLLIVIDFYYLRIDIDKK